MLNCSQISPRQRITHRISKQTTVSFLFLKTWRLQTVFLHFKRWFSSLTTKFNLTLIHLPTRLYLEIMIDPTSPCMSPTSKIHLTMLVPPTLSSARIKQPWIPAGTTLLFSSIQMENVSTLQNYLTKNKREKYSVLQSRLQQKQSPNLLLTAQATLSFMLVQTILNTLQLTFVLLNSKLW